MHYDPIQHKNGRLVITLKTSSPEALHYKLLKGINNAIQTHLEDDNPADDNEGFLALLDLQKAMIPTEDKLVKAYQ